MGYKKRMIESYIENMPVGKFDYDYERAYRSFVWKKGKLLCKNKLSKCLDLGSGTGYVAYSLKRIGYTDIVAVEACSVFAETAEKKTGIKVQCSDIISFLRKDNNSYDMVFLLHVLEHFLKDEVLEILERIYGKLNQGGRLILDTPNMNSFFSGSIRYCDFTHEIGFQESSLRQALSFCGYDEVNFFPDYGYVNRHLFRAIYFCLIKISSFFYRLIINIYRPGVPYLSIVSQNITVLAKKIEKGLQ